MSAPAGPSPTDKEHHAPSNSKPHRVLACVLCQQRKIRCDRTFPCANCKKQNARCVPATQTRPRRKRFPERELLDRLRRYEALLHENRVKFEPLHRQEFQDGAGIGDVDNGTGDDSGGEPERLGLKSPSGSLKSENVTEARSIWHAISQESPSNPGKDTPIANAIESTVKNAWDQLMDGDNILLGMNRNPVDLSTFHPDPVAAFKMWQIYIDQVEPLMKVTHVPSLQPRFIAAVGNIGDIKPALEALMFGIYTMAIVGLKPATCKDIFGAERDDLLTKYQFGCQQALMNAGYLRSSDRECLTALLMHLMSLRPGTNPRSCTAMLGVAVRLAQCLGMHRESMLARCTPFEAEMRRRLWWCLMLYDERMGEKADNKDPVLAPTWDCRLPLNCNDSDLWPEMKEPPSPSRSRTTESLFVVVRSELGDHMRNSSWYLDFSNPCLKPLAKELPDNGSLDALYHRLDREYLRHCDMDNRIQFFTVYLAKLYILRSRLFEHFAAFLNRNGQQSEAERDQGLQKALDYLDCDTLVTTSPLCSGYLWYMQSYFPFPAYMHTIQDLRRRPLSHLAERAWDVMHANYQSRLKAYAHYIPDKKMNTPLFIMFSRTVLTAWEALQKASEDPASLPTPKIVTEIVARQLAAMPVGPSSESGTFGDAQGISTTIATLTPGAPNQNTSPPFAMAAGPQHYMVNYDAMPYQSMVAPDSFTYDITQFNWFLQP